MDAERPLPTQIAGVSKASRILDVLDYAKTPGFSSFADPAQSFLESADVAVKRRVGFFFQHGGFKNLFGTMVAQMDALLVYGLWTACAGCVACMACG
jgi:hypothetical protein